MCVCVPERAKEGECVGEKREKFDVIEQASHSTSRPRSSNRRKKGKSREKEKRRKKRTPYTNNGKANFLAFSCVASVFVVVVCVLFLNERKVVALQQQQNTHTQREMCI